MIKVEKSMSIADIWGISIYREDQKNICIRCIESKLYFRNISVQVCHLVSGGMLVQSCSGVMIPGNLHLGRTLISCIFTLSEREWEWENGRESSCCSQVLLSES